MAKAKFFQMNESPVFIPGQISQQKMIQHINP